MLCLDVHVDARGAGKFKAAFSNLRIVPTWAKPGNVRTECPAPPQVIFVVPQREGEDVIRYAPVATIQYPTRAMLAPANPFPVQRQQPQVQVQPQAHPESQTVFYPSVGITDLSAESTGRSDIPPVWL
jgi:hypothetical protein